MKSMLPTMTCMHRENCRAQLKLCRKRWITLRMCVLKNVWGPMIRRLVRKLVVLLKTAAILLPMVTVLALKQNPLVAIVMPNVIRSVDLWMLLTTIWTVFVPRPVLKSIGRNANWLALQFFVATLKKSLVLALSSRPVWTTPLVKT